MPERVPLCSLCLVVLLTLVCLSGCGQKGDLYLPEESGQQDR
jgi:predicted small lipoprotein YifL